MKPRGFATLEMLIAMTLMVASICVFVPLVSGSQSVSVATQTSQEALYKAQQMLENARNQTRQNFMVATSGPAVQEDIYTKQITITDINPSAKQITSRVSWSNGQYVELSTLVTQVNNDSCNPLVLGNWMAPVVYGYANIPNFSGATDVDAEEETAYLTSDPNSSITDDFFVIDTTGASPGKGNLPVLGSFDTTYGLTSVKASGQYAYVSADSTAFQLLVLNTQDPMHMTIVSKLDVTASGDTAYGNTLTYANNMVYLGLTKSTGPEFYLIDVVDPLHPQTRGSYEVGSAVNKILIKNTIAYLATAANNEVIALNVADSTHPVLSATYTSSTLTGQSLATDNNNTLYFGRIGGTGNPKLLAFNTTDLTAPSWTMNMSKQSGVYSIFSRGNLLFMTTADPTDGLQIWDVSHANASTPPSRYDTSPLNIQQNSPAGTDCFGNLLYVAQRNQRALQIIGPENE